MRRTGPLALLAALLAACPRPAATDAAVDGSDATDLAAIDVANDAAPDVPRPACDAGPPVDAGFGGVQYTDPRIACSDRNAQRNLYWGDLHVHTSLSFDSYAVGNRATPEDAYRFARGEAIEVFAAGGSRTVQLSRPLDFAAVTDHSEFLGEVNECLSPDAPGFHTPVCESWRAGGAAGVAAIGYRASFGNPRRDPGVCGQDGSECLARARTVWQRVQDAAAAVYDRTSACRFTSFVAYEYSPTPSGNNLHRNVIFRNTRVPPLPISFFEAPSGEALWQGLRDACTRACDGCEVLAIPHNSNFASGNMFPLVPAPGLDLAAQRELAQLRSDTERLVEVYQHKGSSECRDDLAPFGAPDEACDFEVVRNSLVGTVGEIPNVLPPCVGGAGVGCYATQDYVRHVLTSGLGEESRLGVNPFQLGIIGSTDTHNGTPGNVDERTFRGHVAGQDYALLSHIDSGPGGLAAVWAVENSRDALFEALRRRETYSTSGPRIAVRFFGGYGYAPAMCGDPALVEHAYAGGVPMGSVLPPRPGGVGAPSFVLNAARDENRLSRAQIVKGWVDAAGAPHERVYDVVSASGGAPTVDVSTCVTNGAGADTLCTVWTDPDFDPAVRAYWYARVLEGPSCRWNTWQCLSLPAAERPASCGDPAVPHTIEERAITSPVWYEPQ
ncbi:MAG: DUF3604 domain-containing protein [Deltaproteobacteria bacterium]